jgi:Mg2+ and Co2+ transporters
MLLDGKTLLTFQDFEEDFLQSVEKRIENHNSLIRKNIQFLFYSVIDTVVDEYYVVLEKLNDKIEEIEELFIGGEVNDNFKVLQLLRNEMRKLRQAVWPLREIINKINKNEFLVISEDLSIYFNDLNDNMKQIIELLENMRETTLGLIDVYMSYVSNRLNDIMKVLTIISTVFIPLTFITGIYGMNFHFMPEIEEPWGYPAALSIMVVVVLSSVLFFKKKKWF